LNFNPAKKEDGSNFIKNKQIEIEIPNNGRELFFSNILMKIYQVPVMFTANSEEEYSSDQSTFIILFYEKSMRKRTWAKSQNQRIRLSRAEEVKKLCLSKKIPRILEDLLPNRDSKMRRFCNYFLTLFNQKKLNPFTQFVNTTTLKNVKSNVRKKMQHF
jgi:hypothetical protein